jgi:hypothetical protein
MPCGRTNRCSRATAVADAVRLGLIRTYSLRQDRNSVFGETRTVPGSPSR